MDYFIFENGLIKLSDKAVYGAFP